MAISQKAFADHLDCDYKVINRIINNHSSVTPDIAIRLSMALGTTPDFWLNAQAAQDIWKYRRRVPKIPRLKKAA